MKNQVGLCQKGFATRFEGLPQMMTGSSKVLRGPVIHE